MAVTQTHPDRRAEPSALLNARQQAGLGRDRLAAIANVSPSTIYKLEVEGRSPTRAVARSLARALGRDAGDLFLSIYENGRRVGSATAVKKRDDPAPHGS